MALIGLKKLEHRSAMATVAAKAMAVAAAVSGDNLSGEEDGGIIIMPKEIKVNDTNMKNMTTNDQQW